MMGARTHSVISRDTVRSIPLHLQIDLIAPLLSFPYSPLSAQNAAHSKTSLWTEQRVNSWSWHNMLACNHTSLQSREQIKGWELGKYFKIVSVHKTQTSLMHCSSSPNTSIPKNSFEYLWFLPNHLKQVLLGSIYYNLCVIFRTMQACEPVSVWKVYPPWRSVVPHCWHVKQLRWKNLPSALPLSST